MLDPIAKKYQNDIHMFTVDAGKYEGHTTEMLLTKELLPAFVIHDTVKNESHRLKEKVITHRSIDVFIKDFIDENVSNENVVQPRSSISNVQAAEISSTMTDEVPIANKVCIWFLLLCDN